MARQFNPARLFEPYREPRRTGNTFDDIAAGRLAVFWASGIEVADAYFTELLEAAMDRDLTVVLRPARRGAPTGAVDVYLVKLDQMWRVPALETLWATAFVDGRWSDAASQQELLLLGVSAKERAQRLAAVRQRQAAWGCRTVYTLVSAAQRRAIVELGKRCFPDVEGMELFSEGGQVLKRNALALIPKGFTLARVGLAWACVWQLFEPHQPVLPVRVPAGVDVNANLVSNVQFLTRAGWK